ncbi:spermidine synthase [Brevibacterium jeotgali]|uniref:Spermidine synthase n=1 Tax=Brevibacterium jeotgali TaxID=1262550 RepID=A0A2H1L6Q0_9MICO|nr:fused MFS/spermidine synthase [Brevibacterium jeotgali]SMY12577.1 Spermidine synthase [Brevibacterium jeotgali]
MSARRARSGSRAPLSPLTGPVPADTGTASFDAVPGDPHAYVLTLNGVPSSPYRSDDPRVLDFEYLRWMAHLTASALPAGRSVRAVHIGGAACALPRHLDAIRPGSRQTVVEVDAALADWVRANLDLPRSPALAIRAADGAQEITRFRPNSIDLIVRDAFAGDTTPDALSSSAWFDGVHAALGPHGAYIANVADHADRTALRSEIEGLRTRFSHVLAVVDPTQFRRRRRGNVVVAAAHDPIDARAVESLVRGDGASVRSGVELMSHLGPAHARR